MFGLAAFLVERRLKETSIRKVLGAGIPGLLGILLRDHLGLIAVAAAIATPVSVFLSRRWLEDYATRIDLGPTPFVLSALICFAAILAAVTFRRACSGSILLRT